MDSLPCTVIIPAAGDSVRYRTRTPHPKGLVKFRFNGTYSTMIEHVVPQSIRSIYRIIVGVQSKDAWMFKRTLPPSWRVVGLESTTGQAETLWILAHMAEEKHDVLVINCDNAFAPDVLDNFLTLCRDHEVCCGTLVFKPSRDQTRYGYVDNYPYFSYGAEKNPISKYALAGAFYYRNPGLIIRHGSPMVCYVSNWFMDMPKPKMSMLIKEEQLFEWGTAEDLIKSVGEDNIIWGVEA